MVEYVTGNDDCTPIIRLIHVVRGSRYDWKSEYCFVEDIMSNQVLTSAIRS